MALNLYGKNGEVATMYDLAARLGENGENAMQTVVELQAQTNDIWQVMPMKACNNGTVEKVMLRKALPEVAWRMLNKGTKPGKSAVGEASFTTGGVEAFAVVDERLLQLNKNSSTWRLSENTAFQEAMNQKICRNIFYGDEGRDPASFTGLSAYFYSKKQDDLYADQIIDAGGTGSNLTSLWFCTFAQDTVYGIYPEGVPAGYKYKDNGRVPMTDADGGKFYGYESQYNWDFGLAVRDPRHVVRVANIDLDAKDTEATKKLVRALIEGWNQLYNPDHGRTVALCNRKVETLLHIAASEKANVNLSIDEWAGKKMTHFLGAPIIRNDAILTTEEQLV